MYHVYMAYIAHRVKGINNMDKTTTEQGNIQEAFLKVKGIT